jgi:ATP/maltotriose-dependent transcriptional regulator MalT
VVDDVHELDAGDLLRQLELVLRAAPELRFVLAARRDMRLGLHRLRLEGELTGIRSADLRFTVAETLALFQAAGVRLFDSALGLLRERTEGWVAGLRSLCRWTRRGPGFATTTCSPAYGHRCTRWRKSAPGRRSDWPDSTAGPTSPPRASPA